MNATVRLILNRSGDGVPVLHREDCGTIQHQVRGDLREELPRGGFQILESHADGTALVGPVEGTDKLFFEAVYITIEDLPTVGRYRRCKTCAPDAPDGPPPSPVNRKRAETLAASDLGRVTVDGPIAKIEHTAAGTVLTLDDGNTLSLGSGEFVSFPKPAPDRR